MLTTTAQSLHSHNWGEKPRGASLCENSMGATAQNQNFHHTRSRYFTKITSGTWKVRSEEGPTNAYECWCMTVHVWWQWREGVTPHCMGHGSVGTHALRLWVKMLVFVFLTSMHNDPFLYIIKYIYIFICIMLLCKGKKNFIYRFGELCIHCPIQNLFITSSYGPLVFSLLFLYPSPPRY